MQKVFIKNILAEKKTEATVTVSGWVRTKRESKNFSFVEINDGSCMSNLQVIINDSLGKYAEIISLCTTGSSIEITGKIVASQGAKQSVEVHATDLKIIGKCPQEEYVLQKKHHTFEYLRSIGHLRARTNTFGAIARIRSAMSFAIHRFFQEKNFIYVHTPIITASDCEGAGQMFQVTTLPLESIPLVDGHVDYNEDFFGKKSSLTVSGQLNGETYACALGNIYTFGPTFRAEHSNTTRHLAEFWMVEPEMAFCDINGNMDTAEEFLKYIFKYLLENCAEDMEFFNTRIDNTIIKNLESIIKEKFERISYTDAIKELEKADEKFDFPVKWGIDLQSEHEKYLTEKVYKKPAIITDYPKEIKAFYMKLNEDNKTVRAMDILVPRLGEIIGGSERENDEEKLIKRINELGLNQKDYWWYLELRKFGSVPHAGFGLGFERLIQFVSGMQNIRDVIPYPRAFKDIDFKMLMKNLFLPLLILFIIYCSGISAQQKIPVIIYSQNKIFNQISKDIKRNLPDQSEILFYDINILNADENTSAALNSEFKKIINENQAKYEYSSDFFSDIKEKKIEINEESIKKQSDLDLIALGKYLEKDVVMLSSISFVEDQRRKIWNKEEKAFQYRKIALFQGNFFSALNSNSLYRFSYYFLLTN